MNKKDRKALAEEQLEYITNMSTENSINNTKIFKIQFKVPHKYESKYEDTEIQVVEQSTISATLKECNTDGLVTVLNFASAVRPCGGWLQGGTGQEESLASATTLYIPLQKAATKMYKLNEEDPQNGYYHNFAVYTPDVSIVRNSDGELLETHSNISVISVPSVNTTRVFEYAQKKKMDFIDTRKTIDIVMKSRCVSILKIAAKYDTETLILGAYGCDQTSKNNPNTVSWVFKNLLSREFNGVFKKVVFAIQDENNLDSFNQVLM